MLMEFCIFSYIFLYFCSMTKPVGVVFVVNILSIRMKRFTYKVTDYEVKYTTKAYISV